MTIQRFLVPVVAVVALGLPARASIAVYCDGGGCGTNTSAAFNSLVASDVFASASDLTFGPALGVLSGNQYTDDLTAVGFTAVHNMDDSTGKLKTQTGTGDPLTISIPAAYSVLRLSLTQTNGGTGFFCLDAPCNNFINLNSTPAFVGYINTGAGVWPVTITASGAASIAVNSFNAASAATNSDTPEIGTLLLIGSGLIAMRWMNRLPRLILRTPRTTHVPA